VATSNAQQPLGASRELGLKLFSGKVLEAFRAETPLFNAAGGGSPDIVSSQELVGGISGQFPIIGDDPTPEYHTPGVELLGQNVGTDEVVITIDDILVDHYDVAYDQTELSHFPVIAPFAVKLGRALGIDLDQKAMRVGINSARTAAVAGFHNGGHRVTESGVRTTIYPDSTTGSRLFRDNAAELAESMDNDNVPIAGRWLFITPYVRRILRHETDVFQRDFNPTTNNTINTRTIGMLEGFNVIYTNHIPSTVITTGPSKYQGDFTQATGAGEPLALALCGAQEGSAGIGYVTSGGMETHMEFDHRRNTTFMKAQMLVGLGVLAPWCAGSIECI